MKRAIYISTVCVASPTPCVFWSVPRVTPRPAHPPYILPSDRSASTVPRERLRCLPCSISSAGSRATSLPSFLPAFIGVNTTPAEVRIRLAEEAYSERSAPQLHPFVMLEWKRLRRTCADADRVWREDGAHSKGSQTPDDPWMPAHKFGVGMRMSADWLIARCWIPQRCSRRETGRGNVREWSVDRLLLGWKTLVPRTNVVLELLAIFNAFDWNSSSLDFYLASIQVRNSKSKRTKCFPIANGDPDNSALICFSFFNWIQHRFLLRNPLSWIVGENSRFCVNTWNTARIYVARSSKTRQQGMGGRVARDHLFNSRKASERMGERATQQPCPVPLPRPRRQSEKTCRLVGY